MVPKESNSGHFFAAEPEEEVRDQLRREVESPHEAEEGRAAGAVERHRQKFEGPQ